MNTEQIKDMHLLYNAVYNEELREQFDEYNNTIYDEDIVEVATEYFYSYGLNEDGIGILIEKVGLESFVEYVYDLSEDLHVLTEARARKKYSGPSYDEVKAGIDAREAKARAKKEAKKKASEAASEKKETERAEPESRGVESQAKAEQPKSKKPERSGIARAISGAVDRAKRDTELLKKSWNTAREVGRGHEANVAKAAGTVVGAAHGAAKVAHRLGQEAGKSETGKKIKKVLFGEEVEAWVNQLVEEGYDLSDYTWDEMAEIYEQNINEASPSNPNLYKGKHGQTPTQYMAGRSDAGKIISGDDKSGPLGYSNRYINDKPTQPGQRTTTQRTSKSMKDADLKLARYRYNSSVKDGNKFGGPKGLPKGGGSSAQDVTDDPNSKPIASRTRNYKVGGSQGYGISGIKLADSYDIYDAILSHLIEEGYAESVEQAEVIMVNMSEEWRESIVEMNNLPSGGKTPAVKYGTGKPGGTMVYATGKPTGKSVYKKGPDGRPSPYQPL